MEDVRVIVKRNRTEVFVVSGVLNANKASRERRPALNVVVLCPEGRQLKSFVCRRIRLLGEWELRQDEDNPGVGGATAYLVGYDDSASLEVVE